MLKKFQIGQYQIDVERNQLTVSGQSIFVEPKVMDVLAYLALKQGEVVSQQELFDTLWPNSVFSSGSVLRSIAQLRKALGDDAKKQSIIVTHPKRGYSLKLEVERPTYLDEINQNPLTFKAFKKSFCVSKYVNQGNKLKPITFTLLVIITAVTLTFNLFNNAHFGAEKKQFNSLIPVSSTRMLESQPKFSPTENSIAFLRKDELSRTHLWLKDLDTKQEVQLDTKGQQLLSFTWSSDGRYIAYLCKTNSHYEIGYLRVPISSAEQITAQIISRFESDALAGSIQWGSDNTVYYLLHPKDDLVGIKAQIHSLNIKTAISQMFWQQVDDFSPHDMSLSPDKESLALTGYAENFMSSIKILSMQNKTLTLVKDKLPTYTEVSWHPNGGSLLLTDSEKLQLLNLNGESDEINWLNFYNIENPTFDAKGRRITLSLSNVDVDVILQSQGENNVTHTVSDSNSIDIGARFSPNDESILYISEQAGYQQIFQESEEGKKLLFANKSKSAIESPPLWSSDGKRVLVNTSSQLIIIDVHSAVQTIIAKPDNVAYVYEWFDAESTLLVDYRSNDGLNIANYNLNSQVLTPIISGNIFYAHSSKNGHLIVIKDNKVVEVEKNKEKIIVDPLPHQHVVASVSIEEGIIFQLNSDLENGGQLKELWKFNSSNKKLTYLATVPTHLDKIIDVSSSGDERLFSTHAIQESNIVLLE